MIINKSFYFVLNPVSPLLCFNREGSKSFIARAGESGSACWVRPLELLWHGPLDIKTRRWIDVWLYWELWQFTAVCAVVSQGSCSRFSASVILSLYCHLVLKSIGKKKSTNTALKPVKRMKKNLNMISCCL